MKTYVLMISKTFPAGHPKAGEPTNFAHAVRAAVLSWRDHRPKAYSIHANYFRWAKRFEKIDAGEACLSIRQWTGRPYASKQEEVMRLTREDGIGLQKLTFEKTDGAVYDYVLRVDGIPMEPGTIAMNDGLSFRDWREWFAGYDKTQPLAIIHFTKLRYV